MSHDKLERLAVTCLLTSFIGLPVFIAGLAAALETVAGLGLSMVVGGMVLGGLFAFLMILTD